MGPYTRLADAHKAIREWCGGNGVEIAGPRWEIYGDWSDNPEGLRTDVYHLLDKGKG